MILHFLDIELNRPGTHYIEDGWRGVSRSRSRPGESKEEYEVYGTRVLRGSRKSDVPETYTTKVVNLSEVI